MSERSWPPALRAEHVPMAGSQQEWLPPGTSPSKGTCGLMVPSQERPRGGEYTPVMILHCHVPVTMGRAEFRGYLVDLEKSKAPQCGREFNLTLW